LRRSAAHESAHKGSLLSLSYKTIMMNTLRHETFSSSCRRNENVSTETWLIALSSSSQQSYEIMKFPTTFLFLSHVALAYQKLSEFMHTLLLLMLLPLTMRKNALAMSHKFAWGFCVDCDAYEHDDVDEKTNERMKKFFNGRHLHKIYARSLKTSRTRGSR
jgi:hypothetical protein